MNASAMSHQDKVSTLSQEASRRLEKMSEDRTIKEKVEVLDNFNQRLLISGYNLNTRREIVMS